MTNQETPEPGPRPTASGHDDDMVTFRDRAVAVLAIEAAALLIGLAMPVTPSKTGSDWTPAQLIWPDPTYLIEVVVYFLMTNALILAIGVTIWLSSDRNNP